MGYIPKAIRKMSLSLSLSLSGLPPGLMVKQPASEGVGVGSNPVEEDFAKKLIFTGRFFQPQELLLVDILLWSEFGLTSEMRVRG